jgi:anti-sigma B factor antagonist
MTSSVGQRCTPAEREKHMGGFHIKVTYAGGRQDIVVFEPQGYIDTTTVQELEKKLTSIVSKKKYKLVIDLSDTEYVNSSGWGVFLRDLKTIRQNGGDIVLANMSPDVRIVYETMEFSQIFRSFDSLDAAFAHFEKGKN